MSFARSHARPSVGPRWIPAAVVLFAVAGDRLQIGVGTGGRGSLSLVAFVAPAAAVVASAQLRSRGTVFLATSAFVLGVLPYLALTAALPLLGVMFNGYPERTLFSATEATTALSFLVVGSAATGLGRGAWSRPLLVAIGVQLAYATGQVIYLAKAPGWELFAPLHAWDLSLQDAATFVEERSSGLYLNPNELGTWAAVTAVLSWFVLRGPSRIAGVTMSLMTLVLSQSRGATAALVSVLVLGIVVAILRRNASRQSATAFIVLSLTSILAVAVAVVLTPQSDLDQRFRSLVGVVTQGPTADANLAGRIDYWSAVAALNGIYPLGTWGSPELLLGTAIDSTWFRVFAQGSVVYLAAFILLIVVGVLTGMARGNALGLITLVVAVAGLTQTPTGYPVIVVFWVLLGATLQSAAAAHSTRWSAERTVSGRDDPTEKGVRRRQRGCRPTEQHAPRP